MDPFYRDISRQRSADDSGCRDEVLFIYTQRWVPGRAFELIGSLGGLTLAARLTEKGYRAFSFAGITPKVTEMIRKRSSRLLAVCFYCDFDNTGAVKKLLETFSGSPFYLLVGGPQTMHLSPQDAAKLGADAILCGDGEESILAWLEKHGSGQILSQQTTAEKKGVYELLSDFSAYPIPDDRLSLNPPGPLFSVISARGCPHRCAFCFEGGNSRRLRPRDPEAVLEEIQVRLEKTPWLRYLFFADDTFTYEIHRLEKFCEGLKKLREKRDFVWFCEGHASFFRKYPEAMKLMVDAGMARMQIGMESGCDEILALYGKHIRAEDIRYTARLGWEAGLPQMAGNFIIGGARESAETAERTRNFVLALLEEFPGFLDISTTFPMPLCGTRLTEQPEAFGISWTDKEFVSSLEDVPVNRTDALSLRDISLARARFLHQVLLKMKALTEEDKIPRQRILENLKLSFRYGIADNWCQYIYRRNPWLMAYARAVLEFNCLGWDKAGKMDPRRIFPQTVRPEYELGATGLSDPAIALCLGSDGRSLAELGRSIGLSDEALRKAAAEADSAYALVYMSA